MVGEDAHLELASGVLLLSGGPLAVLLVETGPVVVDVLVDIDIADSEDGEALVEHVLEPGAQIPDQVEEDEADHHWPLDTLPAGAREDCAHGVTGDVGVHRVGHGGQVVITDQLLTRGHPVSEDKIQKRRKLELLEHVVAEALVVHGWRDVAVEEHESLDDVEDEEGERGDGEQDWHAEAIHEGHVANGQDGGVLVVHEVQGSLVGVDVALDRCALGTATECAATVNASEQDAETPVAENLEDGVIDVEDHSEYDDVTDRAEPGWVKIWHSTRGQPESDWLLRHIGVDHEQEEGRVEELHDESDCGRLWKANCLSRVADPVNEHDADCSEDVVNTDKQIGECAGPEKHSCDGTGVALTDGITVNLSVALWHEVVRVNLSLFLAEALETAAWW